MFSHACDGGGHSTLLKAFRTQEPLGGFQGPLMGLPRPTSVRSPTPGPAPRPSS